MVSTAKWREQNRHNLLRQIISDAVACEAAAGNDVTLDEKASEFYEANAGFYDAVQEDRKALARSLKRKLAVARLIEKHRLRAVQGDRAALEYLFDLAKTAAYALEYSSQDHLDLVKGFAAQQTEWPVLVSPYPKVKAASTRYFASLKVGSNVATPVDLHAVAKVPAGQSPARPWVRDLALAVHELKTCFFVNIMLSELIGTPLAPADIEGGIPPGCSWSPELVIEALKLEKLTKSNGSQEAWRKFALEVAREEAGGDLARHPKLKSIGINKAKSKRGLVGECTVLNKQRVKTPGSLARDAISQAIKNSLGSLAPLK